MKTDKIYVVMVLHQTMNVLNHGIKYNSDLTWEDGMLGAAPLVFESITIIFKSKESAQKAYPGYKVDEWCYYSGANNGVKI